MFRFLHLFIDLNKNVTAYFVGDSRVHVLWLKEFVVSNPAGSEIIINSNNIFIQLFILHLNFNESV